MKRRKIQSSEKQTSQEDKANAIPHEPARPHMVENGVRLVNQPGYPNDKIVNRLAEIFASSFIVERN